MKYLLDDGSAAKKNEIDSSVDIINKESREAKVTVVAETAQNIAQRANTYIAKPEEFGKVQKSLDTDKGMSSLDTLNNDMRPSPEWMGLEVTDDHFFEWIQYLVDNSIYGNPQLIQDLLNARQNPGLGGDQPLGFGGIDYTPEEDEEMWQLFKEACVTSNAEAKEYFYQQPWVLMLTPQAYQQIQDENPGIDDPAEWVDIEGKLWMEQIQREFRFVEQNYASCGVNLKIEIIPELVVIEDPLAEELDVTLPDGSLQKVNEHLRDQLVQPSLKDPNSNLSQQLAAVAQRYGIPAQQIQMVTVARYGQSGGEAYFVHSNDDDTDGVGRAFGANNNAVWGFDNTVQIPGLFHVEQAKSNINAHSAGDPLGNRAWEKFIPDLQTELGLPDNWWPVGVEDQSEEDNELLFQYVKFSKKLCTGVDSNPLAGRLQVMSDPDTTVNILWQEWDETNQEYIGERVTHPVTPGETLRDVNGMTNWQQKLLIGNFGHEVGLIPQQISVNMDSQNPIPSDVTAEEVEGGYNITLPGDFLLEEANPEITSFLINSEALLDGVQVLSQDGSIVTLFVPDSILEELSTPTLDIVVRGFSTDDDRLCTPSTTMQLDLLRLEVSPPEANPEHLDVPYLQSISIDTLIANDERAVDIQIVEESLPSFATREDNSIVFDWTFLLENQTNSAFFEYHTVDAEGTLSESIATATQTFFDENGSPLAITEVGTQSENLNVYPNPSTGPITLNGFENPQYETVRCQCWNQTGQLVDDMILGNESGPYDIDLRDQTPGLYFLKVFIGNEFVGTKKVIKQ